MDVIDDWRPGKPCPECGCESFIFTEETSQTVWFSDDETDRIGFGDVVTSSPEKLECSECWMVLACDVSLETLRDELMPSSQ